MTTSSGTVKTNFPQADSEAEFVARLRAGDESAYETLFRTHSGAMLAVARRFFGDTDDAADAVQDAFVSAFRAMGNFAETARLGTWLHRITVNACLMKLRSRKRSRFVAFEEALLTPADLHSSDGEDTLDSLDRQETVARVRECVAQLPPAYQSVILLRDLEELDTAETAARLGTNEPVVKTRLHRARRALRTLMLPTYGDDFPRADSGNDRQQSD